jgi:hypothetical protein
MPWLRTAMIVALPGHCSITQSGAGIARNGDFQERCHSWAAFQAACINDSFGG